MKDFLEIVGLCFISCLLVIAFPALVLLGLKIFELLLGLIIAFLVLLIPVLIIATPVILFVGIVHWTLKKIFCVT